MSDPVFAPGIVAPLLSPDAEVEEVVEPVELLEVVSEFAATFRQSAFTCACSSALNDCQFVRISPSERKVIVVGSEKKALPTAADQLAGNFAGS